MAYEGLDPEWAYVINEIVRILNLIFVDDGILVNGDRHAAKVQFEKLRGKFAKMGLKLKCASLVLLADKRRKSLS